jgi:hypothetical protein
MDVTLSDQESAAIQHALRTYLTDLHSEIHNTDDRHFKDGLKDEQEVLEAALAKLADARGRSELRDADGREVVRLITLWWTED